MCWDDSLIAIGTEVGSIELYSLKKILLRAEQANREKTMTGGGEYNTAAASGAQGAGVMGGQNRGPPHQVSGSTIAQTLGGGQQPMTGANAASAAALPHSLQQQSAAQQ